jgi:hypothetical protein
MASKKHKIFRNIWFTIVLIFMIWQWNSYQAKGLPEQLFENSMHVEVSESSDKISFISTIDSSETEVIFFQGGLVDPEAYAPFCRAITEQGFNCHIVKMDWRMPAWGYESIEELFELESGKYVLAGHSQGAKMAAQFVYENPNLMKGLILMGTSHPRDFNMNSRSTPTLKLYAEHDGLANVKEVMTNKSLLPQNASLVMIEGGNHSQFGYMGQLLMDESAIISVGVQHEQMLNHVIAFLKKL